MSLFEYDKEKIETAWKDILLATHDFDTAKNVDDLVKLRQLVEHRFTAFEKISSHLFAINPEIRNIQIPVKDGFVTYEACCKSQGWKIVEWLMQLQQIIDEQCKLQDCG